MASAIAKFLRGTGKGCALLLALSGAAALAQTADSLSRADDVVTQADVVNFAEGLVGKPGAAPRPVTTPEQLDQKAQRIASLGSGAARIEVKLGEVKLELEPPGGHCFLDESQPSDARLNGMLHSIFRGDLRMLGAFADCAQLKSWRTGTRKTLGDYGQFLVPLDFLDKKVEGDAKPYIDTICTIMRETGGQLMAASEGEVRKRFEEVLKGAQMNEVRFLGVVGQDDTACYFGLIQNIITEHGDPKTQVDVSTIAFFAGKMVYGNLYAVHEGDETLPELYERQRANVERNRAVNGG